jgi:hypothetical protein
MSRRVIRTVDGQVFSGSRGRFQDRRGKILFKRGFLDTVHINKQNVTTDNVSGSSIASFFIVLVVILVAVLLLVAYSLATLEPLDDQQRNPNVTDITANTETKAKVKPKATVEVKNETIAQAKTEVVVDVESREYFLLGCSQLEKIKQQNKRNYDEQKAISFGYKKHRNC